MTTTRRGQKPHDTFQVSHRERATRARRLHGKWINVRSYSQPDHAHQTARYINNGTYAAYQPPGAYQAKVVQGPNLWPHRPWTVYTRYTGQET